MGEEGCLINFQMHDMLPDVNQCIVDVQLMLVNRLEKEKEIKGHWKEKDLGWGKKWVEKRPVWEYNKRQLVDQH